MAEQLTLDGIEAPRRATDRLFFAVLPDEEISARIERLAQVLRQEHRLSGRSLGAGRFHVSLCHVGDYAGVPSAVLESADAAARAAARMPSFRVVFDCMQSFTGKARDASKRPVVLLATEGVLPMGALRRMLASGFLRGRAAGDATTGYTPHLTLLYDVRPVAPQVIAPIEWTVRRITLVRSLIGKGRHEALEHYPLDRADGTRG